MMCGAVIRIEHNGALKAGLGGNPIPIVGRLYQTLRAVGIGEVRVEFERAKCSSLGSGHGVVGIHAAERIPEIKIRIGDTGVGGSIERIEIESMLKMLDG